MTVAKINDAELSIPLELYEAMGRPRVMSLAEPDEGGGRFLRVAGFRDRMRGRFTHKLHTTDESVATYLGPNEHAVGEFRIANYFPSYYLMRASDHTEFWQAIDSYHEHLPITDQDDNAHRVSDWLSAEVLVPLGRSFLELGCGAGRNLASLRARDQDLELSGVEVNEQAAALARTASGARVETGSLYDLSSIRSASIDVVFTSGVLMHVPHDRVGDVVGEMHRIASRAVVSFELHGPSHEFDFHRYPRDYDALYASLGIAQTRYDIFPLDDFRSYGVAPFHHALHVAPVAD
jgi:SAM-dependent methyltransferase